MKEGLPYVFTGAQPTTADDNPLGGIYNVLFVRLPTVLMGCVYGKNLVEGHPLIIDLGWSGPSEVPPLIVFGALFVILR